MQIGELQDWGGGGVYSQIDADEAVLHYSMNGSKGTTVFYFNCPNQCHRYC